MNRRKWLQMAGGPVAAVASGMLGEKSAAIAQTYSKATRGMPALKITNVKTIPTARRGATTLWSKWKPASPVFTA